MRGRAWVVLVGILLAGIVFLNVSVLQLNRGIARTDAAAAKLERKNSLLRERVAKLDSTERIQQRAEARGFVLPPPGEVTYLAPNPERDAKAAAERLASAPEEAPVAPEPLTAEPVSAEPVAAEPVAVPAAPAVAEPASYSPPPEPSTEVTPLTP